MILYIGQSYTINRIILDIDAVKIELSRDFGSTWEVINANVSIVHYTSGDEELYEPLSYAWTVTGPSASNCLFKISSIDPLSTDIYNISDTGFSIGQTISSSNLPPDPFVGMPPIGNFVGGGISLDTKLGNPFGDRVDNASGINLADGSAEGKPVTAIRGGGGGGIVGVSSRPSWLYTT